MSINNFPKKGPFILSQYAKLQVNTFKFTMQYVLLIDNFKIKEILGPLQLKSSLKKTNNTN